MSEDMNKQETQLPFLIQASLVTPLKRLKEEEENSQIILPGMNPTSVWHKPYTI